MLEGYEVSHIFYLPAILLGGLAEMEHMNVRRIMTHGDKSAAYMANGYARASGKPGICLSQQIGASNLAAGLDKPVVIDVISDIKAYAPKGWTPGGQRDAY